MISKWTLSILLTSLTLMTLLKEFETRKLFKYYSIESYLQLSQFKAAKLKVKNKDFELLELWESILTGRSAPVSKWIKQQYAKLGLNHLFTPSGFHLSSLTVPLFVIIKNQKFQFIFLILIGLTTLIFTVPSALRRMSLVKIHQKIFGIQGGFLIALFADLIIGGASHSMLSFTYSLLFLGIIYSSEKKGWILILFFASQVFISFNQEILISPLILIFSPILNLLFSLVMPFLFLLSWPLQDWQLNVGLFILRNLQRCVEFTAMMIEYFPQFLPNFIFIIIIISFLTAKKRLIILCLVFYTSELNIDLQKHPGTSTYEFIPQGSVTKMNGSRFYYVNGSCKRELIKGFWWEKCSPKRRGSKREK